MLQAESAQIEVRENHIYENNSKVNNISTLYGIVIP
jgi:hypothetical protein